MQHSHSNSGSFWLTGLIIFGLVYAMWLIELPPFTWWDGILMWFYEWVLDFRIGSDSSAAYVFIFLPLEIIFFYLKYLFFVSLVTGYLADYR